MATCVNCHTRAEGVAENFCEACGTSFHQQSVELRRLAQRGSAQASRPLIPADINDVANWPHLDVLPQDRWKQFHQEFTAVAGQLTYTSAAIIAARLPSSEHYWLIEGCVESSTSLLRKLRFLHLGMVFEDSWPPAKPGTFHHDFLMYLWTTGDLVRSSGLGSAEADHLLMATLAFPVDMTAPVAAAAVVACLPLTQSSVNAALAMYATGESIRLWLEAPIAALLCVHPEADIRLATKVAQLSSENGWIHAANDFWEYVYASLTVPDSDGWLPSVIWGNGFFYNGLKTGEPKVGVHQRNTLVQLFRAHYKDWDLENMYGDLEVIDRFLALDPGPTEEFPPIDDSSIESFMPATKPVYCGGCGTEASSTAARFCSECGDRFKGSPT